MKKIYAICGLICLLASCKPDVNLNIPATSGRANFSNYLAIGCSFTAGYADSSLTVSGQLNSYPQRLFEQFQLIPGDSGGAKSYFVQPLLNSDNGYPNAKKILGFVYNACTMDSALSPINFPNFLPDPVDAQAYTWQNNTYNNGQINNIGVPYIRMADFIIPGFSTGNPYASRFYRNATTGTTPFDELNYRVHNLHPSFFTLWLGINDILGYALKGGIGDGTGFATTYTSGDITPFTTFYKLYDSAVRVASSTGATGALINIPYVTNMPYFTVFPSDGLILYRQSQADSLNLTWSHVPVSKAFQVGNNQYMVKDHNNNIRQSVPGELILLSVPQNGLSCTNLGSYTPIDNMYVITTEELQMIRSATDLFNGFIYQESVKYNLAYVDINKYMPTVNTGVVFNGINYNASFISGGVFSLDGVHLTQRGYALIANQVLTTIDSFYHATVPLVDVNKYHGVLFP